jgi:hypothetical protein
MRIAGGAGVCNAFAVPLGKVSHQPYARQVYEEPTLRGEINHAVRAPVKPYRRPPREFTLALICAIVNPCVAKTCVNGVRNLGVAHRIELPPASDISAANAVVRMLHDSRSRAFIGVLHARMCHVVSLCCSCMK